MRNLEPIDSGQVASANAIEQIERLQAAVETVCARGPAIRSAGGPRRAAFIFTRFAGIIAPRRFE